MRCRWTNPSPPGTASPLKAETPSSSRPSRVQLHVAGLSRDDRHACRRRSRLHVGRSRRYALRDAGVRRPCAGAVGDPGGGNRSTYSWDTGRRIREVVGVVEDVRSRGLESEPPATVYWPSMMVDFIVFEPLFVQRGVAFAVRSPLAGTAGLARQIERAVWSVNPDLPIASVGTMQDLYDRSLARTSFTLVMLVAAAGAALRCCSARTRSSGGRAPYSSTRPRIAPSFRR